jgi:ribonucleotide monophosphatase NagD (HAD superfamily)
MPKKKIIAIDFDGTIVENKFPEIGELLPGALEALEELSQHFKIIIWTSRSGKGLEDMKDFLEKNDISYDSINDIIPGYNDFTDSPKVFADIYVDDRNLGGFPGWKATMEKIREMNWGEKKGSRFS